MALLLLVPVGLAVGVGVMAAADHHRAKNKRDKSVKPSLNSRNIPGRRFGQRTKVGSAPVAEPQSPVANKKRKKKKQAPTVYSHTVETFLGELRSGDVPLCKPMTRTYNNLAYHDCFLGSDLIRALVENKVCTSRHHAMAVARKLFDTGCIYHVTDFPTFRSGGYFYRVTSRAATAEVDTDKNVLSSRAELNVFCAQARKWLNERPGAERQGIRAFSPRAVFSSSSAQVQVVESEALATALVVVGACDRRSEGGKAIRALVSAGLVKATNKGQYAFVSGALPNRDTPETCSIAFGAAQAA